MTLPFLTAYDPPGSSEGTLDPLGLYQIADQLGVMLVPAVRERMQRIRFLTAIAVGSIVTEGMDENPKYRDASPYLVWEWHLAEAMVRRESGISDIDGVPGSLVTRRAIGRHGYLDAKSYLKTPRIFGFFGVYKRLAIHAGIVDVHLAPGPLAEGLVDAWARDLDFGGIKGVQASIGRWRDMVSAGLSQKPPRTKVPNSKIWEELAWLFAPAAAKKWERKTLREALNDEGSRKLGALPLIWKVLSGQSGENFEEEKVHKELARKEKALSPLLCAIRQYEIFARSLQDAFDVLRALASARDAEGFTVTDAAADKDFATSMVNLETKARAASIGFNDLGAAGAAIGKLFDDRFGRFLEIASPGDCALALCAHHEVVQKAKSVEGKRPWFDRMGKNRIYIRHAYRAVRRENLPGRYLHGYRTYPIGRFFRDLT
jgi:hypothetical protein